MKVLIASTPAAGHLNPRLSIASLLVKSGHEVAVQVNEDLRPAVEAAGHRFLLEIPNAQTSSRLLSRQLPRARDGDDRLRFRPLLCANWTITAGPTDNPETGASMIEFNPVLRNPC
jgi:hypothetical protein